MAKSGKGREGKRRPGRRRTRTERAGLLVSVHRVERGLLDQLPRDQDVGSDGSVYLAAVLEYLVAEVVELAGNRTRDDGSRRIKPRHLMLAVKNDPELDKLVGNAHFASAGVHPNINPELLHNTHRLRESKQNRRRHARKDERRKARGESGSTATTTSGEDETSSEEDKKRPDDERDYGGFYHGSSFYFKPPIPRKTGLSDLDTDNDSEHSSDEDLADFIVRDGQIKRNADRGTQRPDSDSQSSSSESNRRGRRGNNNDDEPDEDDDEVEEESLGTRHKKVTQNGFTFTARRPAPPDTTDEEGTPWDTGSNDDRDNGDQNDEDNDDDNGYIGLGDSSYHHREVTQNGYTYTARKPAPPDTTDEERERDDETQQEMEDSDNSHNGMQRRRRHKCNPPAQRSAPPDDPDEEDERGEERRNDGTDALSDERADFSPSPPHRPRSKETYSSWRKGKESSSRSSASTKAPSSSSNRTSSARTQEITADSSDGDSEKDLRPRPPQRKGNRTHRRNTRQAVPDTGEDTGGNESSSRPSTSKAKRMPQSKIVAPLSPVSSASSSLSLSPPLPPSPFSSISPPSPLSSPSPSPPSPPPSDHSSGGAASRKKADEALIDELEETKTIEQFSECPQGRYTSNNDMPESRIECMLYNPRKRRRSSSMSSNNRASQQPESTDPILSFTTRQSASTDPVRSYFTQLSASSDPILSFTRQSSSEPSIRSGTSSSAKRRRISSHRSETQDTDVEEALGAADGFADMNMDGEERQPQVGRKALAIEPQAELNGHQRMRARMAGSSSPSTGEGQVEDRADADNSSGSTIVRNAGDTQATLSRQTGALQLRQDNERSVSPKREPVVPPPTSLESPLVISDGEDEAQVQYISSGEESDGEIQFIKREVKEESRDVTRRQEDS